MIILSLINCQNVVIRSGGRLQLATFLFRNREVRFLDQFRSFQQSCWLYRRFWPSAATGGATKQDYRNRRINPNSQILGPISTQRNNHLKQATYCAVRPNNNSANANKNLQQRGSETENIFTVPNALCILRIGMTPFIANMIVHSQYLPAIGLLTVAGVTDLLDGWIARVIPGQSSVMGSFLDPMADKILVGTLFLSLTYMDLIPVLLTTLIVGRDALLIAAGFYIRYQSLDPPKTLRRYFNVALPTAQLAPTFISKVNTGLQLTVVGATLASTVMTYVDLHPYLQILWYATGATTIGSAVWYCFAKDTVKLLRRTSSRIKFRRKNKQ